MKPIQKILGISSVAGALMWGNLTIAQNQPFFFPSASFFSPQAATWESGLQDESIAVVLKEMKSHQSFNSQLESSKIMEELAGQYLTVLAPTDKAFDNLPADIKEKIADPENLKRLLTYHFVAGEITEEDIQRQAVATLLEQTSVSITGIPVGDQIGVKLNDARATEPTPAADGVIIPIDRVLIPPGF
ncbi:Secreted/surface protein with fasciclin-like repeats [Hyella patelloides LEGE 07179]|uniref:Secreted/surface protein with fasciclin-like repeats n=1 Tax=Hyella patelloides LEGE 07179 TaxID=945734 RepID=A0A563VML0_9CYAN|nr:fasciclin domain-containing protein [Hyella patelloides]VEP12652.1 Secreted/surface protein with fasciclin-like repeats [Hyella patelloides LEGE 07179]